MVAVYNLERTVASFVIKHSLEDAVATEMLQTLEDRGRLASMREDRLRLLGCLANKTEDEIEPWLARTAKLAGERLAPWAVLAMGVHADADRAIALYSATLPHEIVEAYANGIEINWPSVNVEFVMGRELFKSSTNRYTGEVGCAPKIAFLKNLVEKGHRIDFVAESWPAAYTAVRMARHHLIVNPQVAPNGFNNRLYWLEKQPHTTRAVIQPGDNESKFDLAELVQRENFQDYFYYIATAE